MWNTCGSVSCCLHYYGLKINKALQTGIYNLLKTTRGNVGQTVAQILEKINVLDEEFEGNLSTMLAPIRGTNQYWFRVKGEVKAMIAEYGSPTLFLTFSCAEHDIAQYLRKVNNAPKSSVLLDYVLTTLFQYRDNFHTNLKISLI